MILRIATYNIHRCVGCDGIEAPKRIAAVLRDIDAEVAALQEVAFDTDGPENILADLARSMDAHAIEGPTLLEQKGRYGNAILHGLRRTASSAWTSVCPAGNPEAPLWRICD